MFISASISDRLDSMSDEDNKNTLSEKFETSVANIYSHMACFNQELILIEAEIEADYPPLVDPSVFYQRAKEMYDSSKNFDHWGITRPNELTSCLNDIKSLNIGTAPNTFRNGSSGKEICRIDPGPVWLVDQYAFEVITYL